MNNTSRTLAAKSTILLKNVWAFAPLALLLSAGVFRCDVKAQCPPGSPEWQYVTTNLARCGDPGFDPNSTT